MKIKTTFLIQGQFITGVDPEVMDIMSRYTFGWLQSQLDSLVTPSTYEPPQTWAHYTAMVDAVKALNPDWKCGMYFSGATYQRQWEPGYPALADAELFHKPDGSLLVYDDGLPGPPPAASRFRWWRMVDEGVRARYLAYMLDWLSDTHFDGLFIDAWSPGFYANMIRTAPTGGQFGLAGGISEGPAHTALYWSDAMVAWTEELTTALEAEGHRVYLNGLGLTPGYSASDLDQVFLGDGQVNTARYGTGFLFEHGHRLYGDVDVFTDTMALFAAGLALDGREGFLQCYPLLFGPSGVGDAPVYTQNLDLARFYLACYLLVQNERSYFWYYQLSAFDPNGDTSSNGALHWSADWDLDYGEPTGRAFSSSPETIRWREYTRGYAVVNPTATTKPFGKVGTFRVWDPEDGLHLHITNNPSTHYQMDPYSGHFLWRAA